MKKCTIGLIGYGTVGTGVVKILRGQQQAFRKHYGVDFQIKKICDKDFKGKDLKGVSRDILTSRIQDVTGAEDIDVVVELIGGRHPAGSIVIESFRNGKDVVSANKELIAHEGRGLFQEALKRNRKFYFESAAGAGVPMINILQDGLAGEDINGIYGIVNGTCNYILSEMTRRDYTFNQALADAQAKGFAERNPALDINGMDSVHKLSILVLLAMGRFVQPGDIHAEGITHISHDDIEYAREMDLVIKLLAIAKKANNTLEVRVHPTLIENDHPLASVNGVFNALFLDTQPLGDISLYGRGAGRMPAAAGVVADLLNLAARPGYQPAERILRREGEGKRLKLRKIGQIATRYYIRCMVQDKPGVLARITGILGRHGISIDSVSQRRRHKTSAVPIVMLSHEAKESRVREALEKIHRLSVVKSKPVAIRMEELP